MRPSSSQWCAVMRINDLNLEHRKFHTDIWMNFFKVRVMPHRNRLPREVVESPIEILKTHLDTCLYNLLYRIHFSRGVGLGCLLRSLPAPAIL